MSSIILIRHAHPQIDRESPSRTWELSSEGLAGAQRLAHCLADAEIDLVFTNEEPKARQTGKTIGAHLSIETRTHTDLREHDRTGVGYLEQTDFEQAVGGLFTTPEERVFGQETGR